MAWLPAAATVAGGIMNMFGSQDTNETNLRIQQQNSAFNAEQSQLNRDFQERMSNTTWQRGVKDMQAAGLNPMLAYSQGGNPAPAGGQASAGQAGTNQNPYAAAGATAGQWADIELKQAAARKTEAEADEIESTLMDEDGKRKDGSTGKWSSLKAANMNADTGRIVNQSLLYAADTAKTKEEERLVKEQIKNAIAENPRIQADAALKRINEILQRHDLPRMEAESRYFKSPIGKESPHNKYGPQTPFRFFEGLGERMINRNGARLYPPNGGNRLPW